MIIEGMQTQSRALFGAKSAGTDHANASNISTPIMSIPLPEKVFVTSFFCPWGPTGSGSGSLLALGLRSRVVVLQLDFSEESATTPAAHTLKEINHDGRVQCLAWDPRTDLCSRALRFATGGAKDVCVFSLTDAGEQVRTMANGHTDYVNDISFQPHDTETGSGGSGGEHLVASGSDDCSLIVHDCQTGRMIHSVAFGSPVMAVKWNPAEGSKLLAAEKGGIIHIFNMISFNVRLLAFTADLCTALKKCLALSAHSELRLRRRSTLLGGLESEEQPPGGRGHSHRRLRVEHGEPEQARGATFCRPSRWRPMRAICQYGRDGVRYCR